MPDPGSPACLAGLERGELRALALDLGEQAYRGDQVFRWIHRHGVLDPMLMSNLPAGFRRSLAGASDAFRPTVHDSLASGDGTVKLTLALADGALIESVLIPRDETDAGGATTTLCVSTQVGCRVRCRFCRSGREGFRRNLDASEIASQFLEARARASVDRVVFMGIGEPLDSYEAVARSIRILEDPEGAALAPRRIVVSTIGRPEGMRRLGEDFQGRVGLAVSLHAADPATRGALVGPRRAAPPGEVVEAALAYPLSGRDRVTVEVVLVKGVNDSDSQARDLAALVRPLRTRVNLIPLNPFEGLDLEPPAPERVDAFRRTLLSRGLDVFVRRRRGAGILAACGQLAFGSLAGKPHRGH